LAAAAPAEVTLIGQDTTSYGEIWDCATGWRNAFAACQKLKIGVGANFLYAYPNRVTQVCSTRWLRIQGWMKYIGHAAAAWAGMCWRDEARIERGRVLNCWSGFAGRFPGVSLRTSSSSDFGRNGGTDFESCANSVAHCETDWMGVFEYSTGLSGEFPRGKVEGATSRKPESLMAIQKRFRRENLKRFKEDGSCLVEG